MTLQEHVLHTGCFRKNLKYLARTSLGLNHIIITKNSYILSWMLMQIMMRWIVKVYKLLFIYWLPNTCV